MVFSLFKLVCRGVLSDESCRRLDVIAFGIDSFCSESNDLYLVRLDVNLCSVCFACHGFSELSAFRFRAVSCDSCGSWFLFRVLRVIRGWRFYENHETHEPHEITRNKKQLRKPVLQLL